MPLLFYGIQPGDDRRRLYGRGMRRIETAAFDSFKIEKLAPYHPPFAEYATFWHFRGKKHSAIAWHSGEDIDIGPEQLIWIPGLHSLRDAMMIAREEFPGIIPGPIVFRFNNENEIFFYD